MKVYTVQNVLTDILKDKNIVAGPLFCNCSSIRFNSSATFCDIVLLKAQARVMNI
jgi:hypothetical protein